MFVPQSFIEPQNFIINKDIANYDKNSKKYKKSERFVKHWLQVDSSNISFLLELIKDNGFPSKERVGNKGYFNAIILLLHFDADIENKVLNPILHDALENKEITPLDYAQIIDRHLVYNGSEPTYYAWNVCQFPNLSDKKKKQILDTRHDIGLHRFRFKCGMFKKLQIIE